MRAQAGNARTVANQDQWLAVRWWVEVGIAAQPKRDIAAKGCVIAQPSAAYARRAVGSQHPAQQQLQVAISRQ